MQQGAALIAGEPSQRGLNDISAYPQQPVRDDRSATFLHGETMFPGSRNSRPRRLIKALVHRAGRAAALCERVDSLLWRVAPIDAYLKCCFIEARLVSGKGGMREIKLIFRI